MKKELSDNNLPVLGWCDTSEDPCYKQLAEGIRDGHSIIYNTDKELDDDLCAFIFYDKLDLYVVFSGNVEYLGPYPDLSAPLAYRFIPEKEIRVRFIIDNPEDNSPEEVILWPKILEA